MVLEIICPSCKNETYCKEGMTDAYCIVCGRNISVKDATKIAETVTEKQTNEKNGYKVTFQYNRSVLSEFDTGCKITIDNELFGVASVNSDKTFVLLPGMHEIILEIHVSAGVNSTDVISSANININSDKKYSISGSGLFRRRINMEEI